MVGGAPFVVPRRRRGRQSTFARNFLAAVGNIAAPSPASNNRSHNNNNNQHSQNSEVVVTPKKSPTANAHQSNTPATATSSGSSLYSPSLWGASPARRSSSTRSQQSGKTEPTLDTLESSLGRESSVASLRQPQPLQRTPNLHWQQGSAMNNKPNTIYEQPHMMTPTRQPPPTHVIQQSGAPHFPQHLQPQGYSERQHHVVESPSTPDATKIYSPPMFPATSPRTARYAAAEYSDHSSLTNSTSRPPGTPPAHTTLEEIRPTESYLIHQPYRDSEQRTTTSSITTHSTPQRAVNSLDAHMQQKRPIPVRHTTEDWESVSTNEVGHGQRIAVQLPGAEGQTLGQSIDQGINMLFNTAGWAQCTPPSLPDKREDGSKSPGRRIHHAGSSVSGASTELATNRAVDLALKRVQEIEKSRGTEQALYEARQALVRLKDTQSFRPSPPPPDYAVHMPVTPPGRLVFGDPSIPAPRCEAKSILSDSTEEGSSRAPKASSMQMLPVGRLDQKVHRMAQQYQQSRTEDGDQSLPNESLPSSIGVEVDSKGVAKSNPALRAVFEQHTLDSLRRERSEGAKASSRAKSPPQDLSILDPALAAVYNPPPPPPNPPPFPRRFSGYNEVRKYSSRTGKGTVVRTAMARPQSSVMRSPSQMQRQQVSPDPILCHGSQPLHDSRVDDCGDSSVVPTVVYPPNLMTAPSHDSSISTGIPTESHSSPNGSRKHYNAQRVEGVVSPLSTNISAAQGKENFSNTNVPGTGRLSRRWPPSSPASTARCITPAPDEIESRISSAGNETQHAPGESGTASIRSSPAWASRQRMQAKQNQSPKPPTSGSRISLLREQLFAKGAKENPLDSFVVRRRSQESLGEPAIDDTSIDLQSVRSAFESARGSVDRFIGNEHDDSDDDTASVKSLKEKFEGSTGGKERKESGVSKVRAMFEPKNNSTTKPFQKSNSELQEAFSKFQSNPKPFARRNARRQDKTENVFISQGGIEAHTQGGDEGGEQHHTMQTKVKVLSVAERIKALGWQSSKVEHRGPKSPSNTVSKDTKDSAAMEKADVKTSNARAPLVTLRASPTTISEAREALRSSPKRLITKSYKDKVSETSESPNDESNAQFGTVPFSTSTCPLRTHPDPQGTLRPDVSKCFDSKPRSSSDIDLVGYAIPVDEHMDGRVHSALEGECKANFDHSAATSFISTEGSATVITPGSSSDPKAIPVKLEQSGKTLRGSPVSATEKNTTRAHVSLQEGSGLGIQGCEAGSTTFQEVPRSLRASPSTIQEARKNLRASPTSIQEARKNLRASPLSMRHDNGNARSNGYVDTTDESQIEQEVAAITATKGSRGSSVSVSSARKFDWFQRAATEAGGMLQDDDPSVDNRPVTPLTPSRVQERVRMFSSANAAISGVRRPVPTPANFNVELREIAKQRPMTPERHRLYFHGLQSDTRPTTPLIEDPGILPIEGSSYNEIAGATVTSGKAGMEEKWFRPQPRRAETIAVPPPLAMTNISTGTPLTVSQRTPPRLSPGEPREPPKIARGSNRGNAVNAHSSLRDKSQFRDAGGDEFDDTIKSPQKDETVQSGGISRHPAKENSGEKIREENHSESGSEFSDGVTLDMSIAEVSGLTVPTALISRPGGEFSVATVEEEEGESESSSKHQAEVEAKRSEASSSQTSEALIPLLNRTLRQRPMSDERSMGDSFFEARAIVANHWSKTSEIGQQRTSTKEIKKKFGDSKDDSSGGWDPSRIETSFPITPSNAGDLFEFESGWEPFSTEQERDDPFKQAEEKKFDDLTSRSTTPTRSNRERKNGSYIDRRYPNFSGGSKLQTAKDSPKPSGEANVVPPLHFNSVNNDIPKTSASFDAGSENSPEVPAISSFESAARLSRSRLARHAASGGSGQDGGVERPTAQVENNRAVPFGSRPSSFFGRTHPQSLDPSWEKETYPSFDPTVPAPTNIHQPQAPSWKPPTRPPARANPISGAMERYGAQHAALLARLRALKEARMRRANAIYARTTSVFPRQVEIDDYSLSTKSSTQFGGSHFMESLKVD